MRKEHGPSPATEARYRLAAAANLEAVSFLKAARPPVADGMREQRIRSARGWIFLTAIALCVLAWTGAIGVIAHLVLPDHLQPSIERTNQP